MPRKGRLIIGAIAKSHGVRGEARLNSYLVGHLDLERVEELTLIPPDGPSEQRRLEGARHGPKGWILKFEGIDTPEDVSRIKGAKVEVDASYLPPPERGEYYHQDLIGLEVYTIEGAPVGTVERIIPRGAQDLLVIDAGGKELLIPAIEPIVRDVDIERGRIVIDPPEGLLD